MLAGKEDWEVTVVLFNVLGYSMNYKYSFEIMDEIVVLMLIFSGVSYVKFYCLGSIQWPCNDEVLEGMLIMHEDVFVCGKGCFVVIEFILIEECTSRKWSLVLIIGCILL